MPLNEKKWAEINEFQLYLYNEGTNFQSYEMLGPHKIEKGWRFAVWAPNAKNVSVAGDFNGWTGNGKPLEKIGTTGVWYGVFDDIKEGMFYKYAVEHNLSWAGFLRMHYDTYPAECPQREA